MGTISRPSRRGGASSPLTRAAGLLFGAILLSALLGDGLVRFRNPRGAERKSKYSVTHSDVESLGYRKSYKLKTDALLVMMGAAVEAESTQPRWDVRIDEVRDIAANWEAIGFNPQEIIALFGDLGQRMQDVACRGTTNECLDGSSTNHRASEYLRLELEHFNRLRSEGVEEPTYCETGFDHGKSATAALLAGYRVYSFDLQRHDYSDGCAHLMSMIWPGKFTMTKGSSLDTVPKFRSEHPEVKCDVLSIDGMHSREGVTKDFENLKQMSRSGSLVFVDDIGKTHGDGELLEAWEELKKGGSLVEKQPVRYEIVLTATGWRDVGWGVGTLKL